MEHVVCFFWFFLFDCYKTIQVIHYGACQLFYIKILKNTLIRDILNLFCLICIYFVYIFTPNGIVTSFIKENTLNK